MTDNTISTTHNRTNTLSAKGMLHIGAITVGGIVGAVAASSCCVLPLVLASVGIGGAWGSNLGVLAPYHPILTVVTVVLLGVGHYLVYRKSKVTCTDETACATPLPYRIVKIVLWGATLLIVIVLVFPYVALLLY